MARLKSLPSLEIIKGFKGVIDFAITRGVPYARSWPHTPHEHLTAASLVSAALFGQVISAFHLLAPDLLALLKDEAKDQPRSERDVYVQATYGYLHENKMSDILDELIAIHASLTTLEDLLHALASIATDEIRAEVVSSALPSGAATQTTLETMAMEEGGNLAAILATLDVALSTRAKESGGNLAAILAKLDVALSTRALEAGGNLQAIKTALQLIDDFALGTNKIFGYNAVYGEAKSVGPVSGTQTLNGSIVPAGEVWVVTQCGAYHTDTTARVCLLQASIGGQSIFIANNRSLGQYVWLDRQGQWVLKAGDYMATVVENLAAGSYFHVSYSGFKMKIA